MRTRVMEETGKAWWEAASHPRLGSLGTVDPKLGRGSISEAILKDRAHA